MRLLWLLSCLVVAGWAFAAAIPLGEKTLVAPYGKAAPAPIEVTHMGAPAPERTTAAVRWDDAGLTVTVQCADVDLVRNLRKRDDPDMWLDDCVDIYLDPGHTHDDMSRWVHVLVNAAGSVLDERGPTIGYKGAGTSLGGDTRFDIAGLTATPAKTADGWQVEVFIPWKGLGVQPKPGDAWGFNVCRENYPGSQYLCWSPTFGPFSKMDRWGHLIFAGKLPGYREIEKAQSAIAARHAALRASGLDVELVRDFDDRGAWRVARGKG